MTQRNFLKAVSVGKSSEPAWSSSYGVRAPAVEGEEWGRL